MPLQDMQFPARSTGTPTPAPLTPTAVRTEKTYSVTDLMVCAALNIPTPRDGRIEMFLDHKKEAVLVIRVSSTERQ